jgi:hypothetical protein
MEARVNNNGSRMQHCESWKLNWDPPRCRWMNGSIYGETAIVTGESRTLAGGSGAERTVFPVRVRSAAETTVIKVVATLTRAVSRYLGRMHDCLQRGLVRLAVKACRTRAASPLQFGICISLYGLNLRRFRSRTGSDCRVDLLCLGLLSEWNRRCDSRYTRLVFADEISTDKQLFCTSGHPLNKPEGLTLRRHGGKRC